MIGVGGLFHHWRGRLWSKWSDMQVIYTEELNPSHL